MDRPEDGDRRRGISPPPPWKALLEYRAVGERAQFALAQPWLRHLPRGTGDGVLVLPGFTASDRSTSPLRRTLRHLDHRTYAWALGTNLGPTPRILAGLVDRLEYVHERTGGPVSIVGWSLGGIYARELARSMPELVRVVVTLGSPIQMTAADRSNAQPMWQLLRRYHTDDTGRGRERDAHRPPLTVPSTSIYSHTDGVVSWQSSLVERTAISENIRVYGSHIGLGFNTAAVFAVADRLAQREGGWTHFRPPWWARAAFPPADDLDTDRLPGVA